MADNDGNISSKNYYLDTPQAIYTNPIKGCSGMDWGMQSRMARVFNPKSGNTVMLAFDHGYIMGPTSGLERIDISIPPLMSYVDVLMATRGMLRAAIPATSSVAKCVRVTYDSSVLHDDMTKGTGIACDMENAIRMNADCVAVQTFIGSEHEAQSLEVLSRTVDAGTRYGIPTLGVVAVGKEMARTERFFLLATRILAETGAHIIKTYFCDGFENVVAQCPVPIVIAGGKKLPELDALDMAYRAIQCGAKGVDMGRNIFQSQSPEGMAAAIQKVVHENYTPKEAFEVYNEILNKK